MLSQTLLPLSNPFLSPGNRLSPQITAVKFSSDNHRRRAKALSAVEAPTMTKSNKRATTSLYEVLRVNRSASQSEIKSAYRSLAKLYHPDTAATEESQDGIDFIAIHNAYATLSDPAARELYDFSIGVVLRRRRWETDQCW